MPLPDLLDHSREMNIGITIEFRVTDLQMTLLYVLSTNGIGRLSTLGESHSRHVYQSSMMRVEYVYEDNDELVDEDLDED